jgi:hypothetical protein
VCHKKGLHETDEETEAGNLEKEEGASFYGQILMEKGHVSLPVIVEPVQRRAHTFIESQCLSQKLVI